MARCALSSIARGIEKLMWDKIFALVEERSLAIAMAMAKLVGRRIVARSAQVYRSMQGVADLKMPSSPSDRISKRRKRRKKRRGRFISKNLR
jgi:hypothetical protein